MKLSAGKSSKKDPGSAYAKVVKALVELDMLTKGAAKNDSPIIVANQSKGHTDIDLLPADVWEPEP